jgi:hypothetical protein
MNEVSQPQKQRGRPRGSVVMPGGLDCRKITALLWANPDLCFGTAIRQVVGPDEADIRRLRRQLTKLGQWPIEVDQDSSEWGKRCREGYHPVGRQENGKWKMRRQLQRCGRTEAELIEKNEAKMAEYFAMLGPITDGELADFLKDEEPSPDSWIGMRFWPPY